MIHDPQRLREVLEEIAEWPLDKRRRYIDQIGRANGEAAAEQIKAGLKRLWAER